MRFDTEIKVDILRLGIQSEYCCLLSVCYAEIVMVSFYLEDSRNV